MRKLIFLSPFIIALYEVLFLYSQNIKEYKLQVLPIPIFIALIFTAITLAILRLVLRSTKASVLATSVFVFIFFSYRNFLEKLNNESAVLGLSIIAFALTIAFCVKYKKNLDTFNKIVFIVSIILIVFPLLDIFKFESREKRFLKSEPREEKLTVKPAAYEGKTPDIYYIIVDRYDGQRALIEQLGYDNSEFINFLKDKGFYVSSNSTANYPKTFLSLASSLNMQYMDFLTEETNGGKSANQSIVTSYIRNNKVVEYLKNRGYAFYNVGSWWEPTHKNPNADKNFSPPYRGYFGTDEFTTGFINTTIAGPVFKYLLHDPIDVSSKQENNVHRQSVLYQFKVMEDISKLPSPKLVFAHFLFPHDPYVFDKNCDPISEAEVDRNTHQKNYINQLICANTKFKKMISDILINYKTPPVIILQADEGTYPMNVPIEKSENWGTADTISLREKFPILNAYLFPDTDTVNLYDSITPVNSFRALFNVYFGENLPLLPDKNYVFYDNENYYQFIDVTDKVAH